MRIGCRVAGLYHNYITHDYCVGYPGSTVHFGGGKRTRVSRSAYVDYNGYRRGYPCRTVICVPVPYRRIYPIGTVDGSRCKIRRVSRSGYVCYNGYIGTYPFKTVFRVSRIFSVLRHLHGGRPVMTVITPSVLTRFTTPIRGICNTVGSLNFLRIIRITRKTVRAAHRRTRRLGRGLTRNRPFVAADYYPSCVRLTRGRVPSLGGCVSAANSPVCCATQVIGRGCPSTGVIFINPYITGQGRIGVSPYISFALAFRRINSILTNVSVGVRRTRPFAILHGSMHRTRKFTRTNNIVGTIGICLGRSRSTDLGAVRITGLAGGGITLLHTCTGANGTPKRFVRIVTYRNNYIANPYIRNSQSTKRGRLLGRLAGCWARVVGGVILLFSLTKTLLLATYKPQRVPTGKSFAMHIFSSAPMQFTPSVCPRTCGTPKTSDVCRLIGKHVVLGGVALPRCRHGISIGLGIAVTSGNSH